MTDSDKQFRDVPTSALRMSAELALAGAVQQEAGEVSSVPVRILARTADPISHPYWGEIVHDLSGMIPRKARTPIDYLHDGEPIGYSDKQETTERGLEVDAELISTQPGDRAAVIMAKAAAGIPWEASIDWNGPGTVLEELAEDETAEVNGKQFSGPGFVVRSWPLRSVAIVPFGADPGTASQFAEATPTTTPVEIIRKARSMTDEKTTNQEAQPAAELSAAFDVQADEVAAADEPQPQPQPQPEPQPEPVAQFSQPAAVSVSDLQKLCSNAPEGFDVNAFIVAAAGNGADLTGATLEYTRQLETFAASAAEQAKEAGAKVAAFDRGEDHPVAFDGPAKQPATNVHPLQQFIDIPTRQRQRRQSLNN